MKNYWLHRIFHEAEASYHLLEGGYLSIGFSKCFSNEKIFRNIEE